MKSVQFAAGVLGLLLLLRCSESSESVPEPFPNNLGGSGALSSLGSESSAASAPKGAGRPRRSGVSPTDPQGGQAGAPSELPCNSSLAPLVVAPKLLSETGLFDEVMSKTIAQVARSFSPQFRLWSDGAEKSRWIYLPECNGKINNANEDQWSFPVGMRVWKQFVVDELRIETRMISRTGPGPDDFLYAHYLWNGDESEAELIDEGTPLSELKNPRGTNYTVPTPATCSHCHGQKGAPEGGVPSRVLGFSAIQLSHEGRGITLRHLFESGLLTHPRRTEYSVPGSAREREALGYLHANCGFCHNPSSDGVAFPLHPMNFYLSTSDTILSRTGPYQTAVGSEVLGYQGDCHLRIDPADPGLAINSVVPINSCILERMSHRGDSRQMPPIDSLQQDAAGIELISNWIREL